MITDRGANALLDPSDVDVTGGVHLHLSGYVLLDPASRPAGLAALRTAHAAGLTTSVDAASAAPLRAAPDFLTWTRGVDLLIANADEAEVLAGPGTPTEQATRLASLLPSAGRDGPGAPSHATPPIAIPRPTGGFPPADSDPPSSGPATSGGPATSDPASSSPADGGPASSGPASGFRLADNGPVVVVKLGAAGAIWADASGIIHASAEPVVPLDTTGAGDAFAAGLLAALLDGPHAALREGCRLGAYAATLIGARPPSA